VRTVEILVAIFLIAVISAAGSAEPRSSLETIEADTAFAEIQRSRGVVLLDVYAEW
jgi:hypothetical protein